MTTEEIIAKINGLKIIQEDWYEEQSFGTEIDHILCDCSWKSVIDENSHRWYETGVQILENTDGKFFGISFVVELKSESMSWRDCYHRIQAFEAEEQIVTSYKLKSK